MKKNLFLVLFFVSANLFATDYYVSNSGSGSNSGTSTGTAWATLSKVQAEMNAGTFDSGDQILFKRGDEFFGSLNITISGITIGAYGEGDKPLIHGLKTLGAFSQNGNIWSITDTDLPNSKRSIYGLFINGTWHRLSRYPNTGFLYHESASGKTQITDNNVSFSSNYWQGGEAVTRTMKYIYDRMTITSNSGGTFNFSSEDDATYNFYTNDNADNGYFIQDHVNCLDVNGEWTYNSSSYTLQVYHTSDLNLYTVQFPTEHHAFNISADDVTIQDISLLGYDYTFFDVGSVSNLTIQNIDAEYASYFLIESGSGNMNITGSNVKNIFSDAVNLSNYYGYIYNNTFENIGMEPGLNCGTDDTGFGYRCLQFDGEGSQASVIRRNTLKNIGYNVIGWYACQVVVDSNFVDGFCQVLNDGGAIYTYGNYTTYSSPSYVRHNIVMNGGNPSDGASEHPGIAFYQDNSCENITWEDNVAINVDYVFKANEPINSSFINNKAFDIGTRNHLDYSDAYAIQFSAGSVDGYTVTGNTFVGNKDLDHMFFVYHSSMTYNNVTMDNNHYLLPFNRKDWAFRIPNYSYFSLSEWQSSCPINSAWEDNSTGTPATIDFYGSSETYNEKVRHFINPTPNDSVISLNSSYTWADINGNTVSGQKTISPYDAEIFFITGIGDGDNPPFISNIPNQSITSGQTFNNITLDDYVEDPDTPDSEITWSYRGNTNLSVSITNRVASITYPGGWTGSEEIIFTASDGSGSDSDTVLFQVSTVPLYQESLKLDESNYSGSYGVTINSYEINSWNTDDYVMWSNVDLDNVDSIIFAYTGGTETDRTFDIRIGAANGTVIYQGTTPVMADWSTPDSLLVDVDWNYGTTDLYYYATTWSLANLDYIRIVYNNIVQENDPPVVSGIPDQSINSGASFSNIDLDAYVYDSDTPDSLITWTYSGIYSLSVAIVDRVVTINYPSGWTGSESIIFTASDGTITDSDTVTFLVIDTIEYSSYKIDETNEDNYNGVYPNEPTAITGWATGDWCAWYDVDLDNVNSIVWSYGVPYDDRTWEMRLDSAGGQIIYQGTNVNTGNWDVYDSLRADVDFDYGVRDVYLYATSVNTWNLDYLRFIYEAPANYSLKISDLSTSSEKLSFNDEFFTIYPVPAKGQLTIKINKEELGIGYKAIIYDMTGKAVKAFELHDMKSIISIEELNSGIYMLKINADRSYSRTFVIE